MKKITPPPTPRHAGFFLAGTLAAIFAAVPAADAMVASVWSSSGTATETHNTDYATAGRDISEIWNRTVQFNGGTGTYLGKGADGTHYVLTANHVSASSASIATTDGTTHSLNIGNSRTLAGYGNDARYADLKVVAVSATDAETSDFLDSLGTISIFNPGENRIITTSVPLYAVGTGIASSVGNSYGAGTRQKEWAMFTRDDDGNTSVISVRNSNTTITRCYFEIFSNTKTSFQGCTYDSGSGVFAYEATSRQWMLIGTLLAVGNAPSSSTTTIGYIENASEENSVVCATYFADLALYADQIESIMTSTAAAIPEPSAFIPLAGTLALAFAAMRRRRKRSRDRA